MIPRLDKNGLTKNRAQFFYQAIQIAGRRDRENDSVQVGLLIAKHRKVRPLGDRECSEEIGNAVRGCIVQASD